MKTGTGIFAVVESKNGDIIVGQEGNRGPFRKNAGTVNGFLHYPFPSC